MSQFILVRFKFEALVTLVINGIPGMAAFEFVIIFCVNKFCCQQFVESEAADYKVRCERELSLNESRSDALYGKIDHASQCQN